MSGIDPCIHKYLTSPQHLEGNVAPIGRLLVNQKHDTLQSKAGGKDTEKEKER